MEEIEEEEVLHEELLDVVDAAHFEQTLQGAEVETDKQIDRQVDRKTDKQADWPVRRIYQPTSWRLKSRH